MEDVDEGRDCICGEGPIQKTPDLVFNTVMTNSALKIKCITKQKEATTDSERIKGVPSINHVQKVSQVNMRDT